MTVIIAPTSVLTSIWLIGSLTLPSARMVERFETPVHPETLAPPQS